jgi:hypothetical protein
MQTPLHDVGDHLKSFGLGFLWDRFTNRKRGNIPDQKTTTHVPNGGWRIPSYQISVRWKSNDSNSTKPVWIQLLMKVITTPHIIKKIKRN